MCEGAGPDAWRTAMWAPDVGADAQPGGLMPSGLRGPSVLRHANVVFCNMSYMIDLFQSRHLQSNLGETIDSNLRCLMETFIEVTAGMGGSWKEKTKAPPLDWRQ